MAFLLLDEFGVALADAFSPSEGKSNGRSDVRAAWPRLGRLVSICVDAWARSAARARKLQERGPAVWL
jgi:hypothetical protein